MKGKLLVIDGLDGSGKQTQAQLLAKRLEQEGRAVRQISFPDYEEPSSALVKEYLRGRYGSLNEVSAYAASSFYAVDRYASYQCHWKEDYQQGKVIVADRYVTSNLIYQLSKLPKELWEGFAAWLEDFEYNKLGLPRPDLVLYLDMEPEVSKKLLSSRYHGDESKRDIHEANFAYLLDCRKSALWAGERYGWRRIPCSRIQEPLPIQSIHSSVYEYVSSLLKD